jgi:hypothetical protein
MRDSTTFQAILAEGLATEARKILLRQASRKFGAPGSEVETALQGIADLERLERMIDRAPEAADWQDLLATP